MAARSVKQDDEWRAKLALIQHIKTHPCARCNTHFPPECLQFDHLPNTHKAWNVSEWRQHSYEDLVSEIQKCQLVCANCHLTLTQQRSPSYIYKEPRYPLARVQWLRRKLPQYFTSRGTI